MVSIFINVNSTLRFILVANVSKYQNYDNPVICELFQFSLADWSRKFSSSAVIFYVKEFQT